MRIIQTVNYGLDKKNICKAIEYAKQNGAYGIRFNFCRFTVDEWDNALNILGNIIKMYGNVLEFSIDLPYPMNKIRVLENTLKGSKVVEGKEYKITTLLSQNKGDIVVSCNEFCFHDIKDIIYYGDGEGGFKMVYFSKNELLVKALNTFFIWNGKSFNCGLVPANSNIYNLITRLETLNLSKKIVLFLSFVKEHREVSKFKNKINLEKFNVVSKIEAVNSKNELSSIIDVSDGILLARGDMAIYMSQFNPLNICKQISEEAIGKRLFGATDILLGLQNNLMPSRAEIMDYYLLLDLGCTDIILTNFLKNGKRIYKYIYDSIYKK